MRAAVCRPGHLSLPVADEVASALAAGACHRCWLSPGALRQPPGSAQGRAALGAACAFGCGFQRSRPRLLIKQFGGCREPSCRKRVRFPGRPDEGTLDAPPQLLDGDSCMLPEWDDEKLLAAQQPQRDASSLLRDALAPFVFYVFPFAGPAFAFWQWKNILFLVHSVIGDEKLLLELLRTTLAPATNGIVVGSLAIALGTLTSVTVSSLRQRLLIVRSCLNREACELALLQAAVTAGLGPPPVSLPRHAGGGGAGGGEGSRTGEEDVWRETGGEVENPMLYLQVLQLLRAYVARIFSESSTIADTGEFQQQGVAESELMGILGACRYAGPPRSFTCYPLRDEVTVRMMRLDDARSERLAYLTTAFPPFHWVILALLAGSIVLCFLIEVDQSEGRFLSERPEDSLRLRIVFTLMIGAFCGLTALCADLNEPFRGSFSVEGSTRQFARMLQVLDLEIGQVRATSAEACGGE